MVSRHFSVVWLLMCACDPGPPASFLLPGFATVACPWGEAPADVNERPLPGWYSYGSVV